ncbi:hypothetical protein CI102_13495 [Trichoderma harzianum]|nr:hypothetical protein CI102_13495 [Trichoderma harzianum]
MLSRGPNLRPARSVWHLHSDKWRLDQLSNSLWRSNCLCTEYMYLLIAMRLITSSLWWYPHLTTVIPIFIYPGVQGFTPRLSSKYESRKRFASITALV